MTSDSLRSDIIKRYENGNKKLLVKFQGVDEDEIVIERIRYNENGDILSLEKPLENILIERDYYENGRVKEERNFKDDKFDGKYTDYYENGQVSIERNYKEGKLHGKWIMYYENGKICRDELYKNGEEEGEGIFYNEDGQIEK